MADTTNLAAILLNWRTNVKFYHWNTISYARHVATDNFVGTLDTAIDSIIEKYIARYGRPTGETAQHKVRPLSVDILNDQNAPAAMKAFASWLQKEFPKYVSQADTDLINLRDDLLGHTENLIYLMTLN